MRSAISTLSPIGLLFNFFITFWNTTMTAYAASTAAKTTGHAGEWLEHEIREILLKIHRNERLSRADLATGALALSMTRRYSTLLAPERLQAIQRFLVEINTLLAAHPELLPYDA
jgi:hypothetical protein